MTASMASMLDNFNRSNIKILLELGYDVTLAANFSGKEDSSPLSKLTAFKEEMETQGCHVVQIDFSRKIANFPKQLRSYRQLRALATGQNFTLVHCNSPICAAMTRLAFRKKKKSHGTRVIYTAHGFHFFRGAPVKNWLIYFPVEWICAHWTDILNTVNREDYGFARKWLKAGRVVRLPGVGIDLEKFKPGGAERETVRKSVRRELGIGKDEKVLLSVGELSRRKNQESVIQALGMIRNSGSPKRSVPHSGQGAFASNSIQEDLNGLRVPVLRYVVCGQGEREKELQALASELDLTDQVIFPGYREDIPKLCQVADLFIFPSLQEGLPMALMEAIAVKTPVVCSDIRGNRELVPEKWLRFDPKNPEAIAACICQALRTDMNEIVERHYRDIRRYQLEKVERKMREEYGTATKASTLDSAGDKAVAGEQRR